MIAIKLSADNVRLIRRAKTEGELRGVVDLVLQRITEAEASRLFKPEPASKHAGKYNWRVAKEVMGRVLGDDLTAPPFPDPIWYQRVHRTMKMYNLDEAKLTEIAEYAKANLRLPIKLDFLVGQHERIMAGEWDITKQTAPARGGYRGPIMDDA